MDSLIIAEVEQNKEHQDMQEHHDLIIELALIDVDIEIEDNND